MAGETSGPSEQEIRMVAFERKFDELLNFVQLMVRRNLDDEDQRKEDNKNTNDKELEGHPYTNTTPPSPTPPRPPTSPKPKGKDSQLGSKIDNLEEKIWLMQGHPDRARGRMVLPTEEDLPLEGAGGFNSQIAPDRFDLQRIEKKSSETFREYAQRWREKAARARPPLDEREMIKIFVETLKNPYFDRMIAEQAAKKASAKKKEGDVQMIGRSNGRPRQALPTFTMQPIQSRPTPIPILALTQAPAPALVPQMLGRLVGNQTNDNRPTRREPRQFTPRDFDQNLTCDFHFGEVGHAVENCQQLRRRVQDLIDHGILKFEGLPNITINSLPNHLGGEMNMVEIEEEDDRFNLIGDQASWKHLFHTLKEQGHITPLEAPPGPSTGDTCEYHSGARGHSLECCKEFKDEITSLTERGLIRKEETQPRGSYQPYDPSDLDWYAELDLDNILEEEMDLDDLLDEEDSKWYYIEKDADEWRDVDFSRLLQFPCLIIPRGFETPEFEIFYENRDPESHLQKYYEEPYVILDLGVNEVIVEIKGKTEISSLPALTNDEEEEEEKTKTPPTNDLNTITTTDEEEEQVKPPPLAKSPNNGTTIAEEVRTDPPVEDLSIDAITTEGDSTTLPIRRSSRERKQRCGPVYHCYSVSQVAMSKRITRKTPNNPHVSEIDNKADCSFDNIDNSDEEVELPNDILEALERQDEGSKPNIEELEVINLAQEGEEPKEVKIGTRFTSEQKEALIALLREFHEIFAWSYQDMSGLDTDIVVHRIPLKSECKPVRQALQRMKPEVILKIKEEVEKQLKARFQSTVTYSDWVANIVPVPKKDEKVRMCVDYRDLNRASLKDNFPLPHVETLVDNTATNAVFSFMDEFSGYNQIKTAEDDKSKTAFITH
uniref:Reverse transcriptase domain-containing protein n=1 Tax=Fagus sylvatica TaxID=28930 RepID=A0A2N9FW93_FAGSY